LRREGGRRRKSQKIRARKKKRKEKRKENVRRKFRARERRRRRRRRRRGRKNVFFGRKRRGRPARAPIAERWTPKQRHHFARVRAKFEEIHLFQFNRGRVDHVLARGRKCLVVVEEQKKTGAISRTREGRSDVSAHAERRRGRESSEWRFR
jgi:hypothetical protein